MLQKSAEAELAMARDKYKKASEDFDPEALLAAQEALTEAKLKIESAKNFDWDVVGEAIFDVYKIFLYCHLF